MGISKDKQVSDFSDIYKLPKDSSLGNHIPKNLHKKLKQYCVNKNITIGNWIIEKIEQDILVKENNSKVTLDEFQDPNFKPCPLFYSSEKKWENYYKSIADKPKEWKEADEQLNMIVRKSNKVNKLRK
jgi:hypothetical protein